MSHEDALTAARTALADGRLAEASARIEALRGERPGSLDVRRLQGQLFLRQRRPRRAAAALEAVLAARPDDVDCLIDYGRALNNAGQLDAALRAFERAAALEPAAPEPLALSGHVLQGLGRLAAAEAAFRAALDRDPLHLRALKGLGAARLAAGDAAGAAEALTTAMLEDPRDANAAAHLGAALHRRGDLRRAEVAYRRALELDPGHAEAWLNLGITLQDTGRLTTAIEAYREAAGRAPGHLLALNRLADALLAAGRAGEALSVTDDCLARDPGNPSALAARGFALRALGRDGASARLLDWSRLVQTADVVPPDGQTLADFNGALREHVLTHPTLSFEPEGHATRAGRHTGDLLAGDKGPVAALEAAVLAAAAGYLRRIGPTPELPFPGPVPEQPRLAMWAVVMDTGGHQLPHIHPAAWLSGVYYVDLPSGLGPDPGDPAGWIEFGRPPDDLDLQRRPDCSLFRPTEGRLFMFPSYFYHRTIPFSGPEPRICIAFDVLRQAAPGP
jgi:tetratricopeptide (TPR) repeat protein